jgi:hydrogenase maturation protease
MTGKTLVIGLGNPILGDDGVGWRVAEEVKRRIAASRGASPFAICLSPRQAAVSSPPSAIEVDCFSLGGLSLMERLVGYDHAILIDAVTTGQPPGTVSGLRLDELPDFSTAHTSAAHDASLQHALKLGRALGAPLPDEVWVVGIEAHNLYDFSEELTPEVAAAVPCAVRRVIEWLGCDESNERRS